MLRDPLLEKAQAHLDAGEESKARDCAQRAAGSDIGSAHLCTAWGQVCEEVGLARLGRDFYEKALRIAPNHIEALWGLAGLLAEGGHLEKSVRHLKKLLQLQPHHAQARSLLAEHYREMGLPGQAAFLGTSSPKNEGASPLRFFKASVSRRDTQRLLSLFSGRETGFATQEISTENGESRLAFHAEVLTHELLAAHIQGDTNLAFYPLRSDHTVGHAVLSVRISGNMTHGSRLNPSFQALFEEKLRRHLLTLALQASRAGLPAYPELSGSGMGRLWFFFDSFIHFLKARRFLRDFLEQTPAPETPLLVEPLLPTKPVGIGWVEQAVLLPLGLDRATLRRSLFLDSEGNAAGEQLKFLHRIRPIPLHSLRNSHNIGLDRAGNEAMVPVLKSHKALKHLLNKCPVLNELAKSAISGRMLRRDEKVVLFYTIGWLDQGEAVLHEFLHASPDYQFESVRRQASRLKGSPMSCVKIRHLIPELTASLPCQCDFDLRGGKYPSPLLHVDPHLVPVSEMFTSPSDLSLKEAAKRYSALLQHAEETQKALARLERILERGFQKKKLTCIRLDRHELVRIEKDGRVQWKMEFK